MTQEEKSTKDILAKGGAEVVGVIYVGIIGEALKLIFEPTEKKEEK